MAFAFAIPAIGSTVLPALGTAVGGLGTLASSIPVIGGPIGSILGTGAGAGGLSGALSALGTGGTTGGLLGSGGGLAGMGNALQTGLSGILPSIGNAGSMSGLTQGLGQMYTGADSLLGGLLPNVGGAGIAPSQGYLGGLFPQSGAAQGPQIPLSQQFQGFLDGGAPVSQANIDAGLTQMGGNMGPMGMIDKIGALGALGQNFMGGGQQQPAYLAGSPSNQAQPVVINAGGGQAPAYQQLAIQPSGFIQPAPVEYKDQLSNDDQMSAQARSLKNFSGARPTSL